MTDLIAEIDALAEGWDTKKLWIDECGPHRDSRKYVLAIVNAYPQLRDMARDAERYRWMTDEPEGAMHLLNLLKQKKGTIEDFGKMIDRIKKSKDAAMQGGDKSALPGKETSNAS